MPRHRFSSSALLPLTAAGPSRQRADDDPTVWARLDRAQVLGTPSQGHSGCVNALSWSDDGQTLLSGSDDKRVCIWAGDADPTNTVSPHPMKLLDTIWTGHRQNIFSAKYLPNTSTPTIVTCAGDSEVRIFEVERLNRSKVGMDDGNQTVLYGFQGPGVRVLRCHHDRTKRIATENSPFLFLTVSEDGTVRQHDLRRPHVCRSECPEPLFRAPRGIDLYSLSVSTVTPHIFSVAGRTDVAYVCDRRMTERQTPTWGGRTVESGHVNCVRRLGLTNEQWESMGVMGSGVFAEDRHITCVKMSPEHADEVICAFAQHSTSLFSLYDSPPSSSMRHGSPSLSASTPRIIQDRTSPSPPHTYTATDFEHTPLIIGKRRLSERSSATGDVGVASRAGFSEEREVGNNDATHGNGADPLNDAAHDDTPRGSNSEIIASAEDGGRAASNSDSAGVRQETSHEQIEMGEMAMLEDDIEHDFGFDEHDEFDDDDDDDDDDHDWDMEDHYDEYAELEERFDAARMSPSEFEGVEMLLPRRSFKGARNAETVKDCNFLGTRADKVCSGSDDGNFFVWDKETGRLDGIWEGDSHVVNVMEQHPTLPLVAVSGIDNTVKIFSPLSKPPRPSFSRLAMADTIIQANTDRTMLQPSSFFGSASILDLLASRGIQASMVHRAGEDGDGEPQCRTQ